MNHEAGHLGRLQGGATAAGGRSPCPHNIIAKKSSVATALLPCGPQEILLHSWHVHPDACHGTVGCHRRSRPQAGHFVASAHALRAVFPSAAADGHSERHARQFLRRRTIPSTPSPAIERGLRLVEQGADLLDVGGESTRPYSTPVEAVEELRRVVPVVEALCERTTVPMSIDTSKASVAAEAVAAGARDHQRRDGTGRRSRHAAGGREDRRGRLRHAHARHAAEHAGQSRRIGMSSKTFSTTCNVAATY